MKNNLLSIVLLALTVSFTKAQSTETRSLSDFNEISIGEAIELTLVPGNTNVANIKTSNIDLEDVLLEIRGNTLKIGLGGTRHRNVDVEITLTYKTLGSLSISSAANVSTNGAIKASSLDITVSSAADAVLEISTNKLDIDISSAGELELSGTTTSQRVDVSSAGEYNGYDLDCEDTYVRAASAGSARVMASKKIEAKASSAGSIKYKGDPEKVYVSSNSGGSASQAH